MMNRGIEHLSFPMRKVLEKWDCLAWRREYSEENLEHLLVPKGGPQEGWGGSLYKWQHKEEWL